jgi:uncharacterized protein YjcR
MPLETIKYDPSYYDHRRSVPRSSHHKLVKSYKTGTMKVKDLATAYKVSRKTIQRIINKYDTLDNAYENRRKIKRSQYKGIFKMYCNDHTSIVEIARTFAVKPVTIRRILWPGSV